MKSLSPSRWSRTLAFTAPAVALGITQAHAAFDVFVKVGDLKGESTDLKHPNWIEALSFSFGIENTVTSSYGGPPEMGIAKATPFSLVKHVDKASPDLFFNIATGQPIATLEMELVKSGGTTAPVAFYKIKLENVIITRMANAGSSGDDVPSETIQFYYDKITVTYVPIGPTGKAETPISRTWDFANNMGK